MIKTKSIQKTVVALLIAVALFGCAKSGNNLPATEKNSVTQSAYDDKNTTVSGSTKAKRPHRLPMQKAVTKVPPTQP